MDLIDEKDRLGALQFVNDPLEPFFELSAVHGAGDQRTHIQLQHTLVQQLGRDVAVYDSLCQTFHDRCFPNARFADQRRVVLGAAGEDLDHALDLIFSSDDRIQFACGSLGCQVGRQLVHQRRFLFLQPLLFPSGCHLGKFRRRGCLLLLLDAASRTVFHGAAQLFTDPVFVQSHPFKDAVGTGVGCFDQAEQQMLRADIIFMGFGGTQDGPPQYILYVRGKHFLRTGDFDRWFFGFHCGVDLPDPVSRHVQIFQYFSCSRSVHLDQTQQQMFRSDLDGVVQGRFFVGKTQNAPRSLCKLINSSHNYSDFPSQTFYQMSHSFLP